MTNDPIHPEPVVVADFATEFEAAMARNALIEAGIRCEMSGQTTAGFRAEAPGRVRLLVTREDLDRARLVLGLGDTPSD